MYKKAWVLTGVIAAYLSVAGCAPTTAAGVRELGAEKKAQFIAPKNYQEVYRTVLNQYRKCLEPLEGTAVVGDLFTDIKQGSVSWGYRGFGVQPAVWYLVDVSALDESTTRVVQTYAIGPVGELDRQLQAWVLNGVQACRS